MHKQRRLWLCILLALSILAVATQTDLIDDGIFGDVPTAADDTPPLRSVWIIGDSITRGLYAGSEAAMFRQRIFANLQDHQPGQIRLFFWEGMCTLGRLEARWQRLERLPPPTILFIELGVNDVLPSKTCEQVPEADWQAHYSAMLSRFQQFAPEAKIVVGEVPWLGWDAEHRQRAQIYNQGIRYEAERRGLAVAGLWAATVDRPDGLSSRDDPNPLPPDYHGDGFHPNDLGHKRIADAFLSAYHWYYRREGLTYFPLVAGG